MMIPRPNVSMVIPTYQRCASVHRLLTSLARQTLPAAGFEVIVAIDGSADDTREMVDAFSASYALRAAGQPHRGRAAACNLGIREALGQVVVILDDDMEPTPGFLAAHWERHRTSARIGVLGAVPIEVNPDSPPVVQYIGGKFNSHLARLARPGTIIDIRDFYSGNFSISRDLLLEVGGFDEQFQIYGNEDGDLAARLQQANVQLVYSPEAEARQHYEKNFAALARDNIAKGRTAVLCASKHPDKVGRLKIGTLRQGSRKWRALRSGLVKASAFSGRLPDGVVQLITHLERRHPVNLHNWYARALDYFFWLGVDSELRDRARAGDGQTRQLLRVVLKAAQ
jgi:glycosyltransferase involved in cell wall biosynthesis